ncbi:hypothetical protein J4Q44_G00303280 [Coregonus suidteri]|uniref:Uncharacterized protein n=1 Tax=Coregonus suidteri TaxID=861788 RepID=A0AAN8QIX3_9TELE
MAADVESPAGALQVRQELALDPVCIMLAVGHKGVEHHPLQILGPDLLGPGTVLGPGPLPDHAQVPQNVQLVAQSHHNNDNSHCRAQDGRCQQADIAGDLGDLEALQCGVPPDFGIAAAIGSWPVEKLDCRVSAAQPSPSTQIPEAHQATRTGEGISAGI